MSLYPYYIIVAGNSVVGYSYVGPFDCEEDAEKETTRFAEDDTIQIVELHEPTFSM